MAKLNTIPGALYLPLPELSKSKRQFSRNLTTADYRRILSELKLRPPTQRAFLRKLLTRALATGALNDLPAPNHVVDDPVVPS